MHPYTHSPPDVMHIVAINRRVMNRNGDQRKTISLTETGWCTDNYETVNQITWNTHDGQQATNLTRLFTALVRERKGLNVQSVYWFNWYAPQDHYVHGWEDFCGLRERKGGKTVSKPVLSRVLEDRAPERALSPRHAPSGPGRSSIERTVTGARRRRGPGRARWR